MKIQQVEGRYLITWHAHISLALSAKNWCYETFGDDAWGESKLGVPNGIGIGQHLFIFHRLAHANWFMLKYGT